MSRSFSFYLCCIADWNLASNAKLPPDDRSTHGSFHFFISQAVDERIQHGDHRGVEHRHHFIDVQRKNGTWPHIDKEESPV